MVKQTYKEKLLDPRWQKLKNSVLQRDDYTCQLCGDTTTTLHVHHKKYHSSGNPWDSPLEDLTSYCSDCHILTHNFGADTPLIIKLFKRKSKRSTWYICLMEINGDHGIIIYEVTKDDAKIDTILTPVMVKDIFTLWKLTDYGKEIY